MKRRNECRVKRRELIKKAGLTSLGITSLLKNQEKGSEVKAEAQGGEKGLLGIKPSPWFQELPGKEVGCKLCPKECRLSPGERGLCQVRENRDGVLHTLVYGNPALIQEDPVERKPFFHVLPGSRALSISTAGCNLHCKFCEVWDMALVAPEDIFAYNVPPAKVIELAKMAGVSSISYAFGEPVIFYEYMEEVAGLAREAGLLNLIHTAGYIQPEPLEKLVDKLDGANVDLKSFDPSFYRDIVGGELEVVLKSLKILKEAGVHTEITTIIIPTLNDDLKMIKEMVSWIVTELGSHIPLHIARFYPLYRLSGLPRTPVSTIDALRKEALLAGLEHVYVARVTGHEGENTFCPNCNAMIIKRVGFVIEDIQMKNGRCSYCDYRIKGRWSV